MEVEIHLNSAWVRITRGESTLEDVRAVVTNIATALQGGRDLVLALGCGAGLWLNPLMPFMAPDQTLRRAVVVIEPIKELLLLALSLNDMTAVLESQRIFWCVGLDWRQQLKQILVEEGLAAASRAYACNTCPAADTGYTDMLGPFAEVTGEAQQAYQKKTAQTAARLAEAYDNRGRGAKPKSVYVLTHRQGLRDALRVGGAVRWLSSV